MANADQAAIGERPVLWRAAVKHCLLIAGIALIVAAAALLVRKLMIANEWPNKTDLSVYLNAAGAILRGDHPYNPAYYQADPYGYPPLFAELIAVLRLAFDTGDGWLIWPFFCAACLVVAIYLIMRHVSWRAPLGWVALAAGVIMFGHIGRSDLYHGQPDFLLLLLLIAGLMRFRSNKPVSGALLWGAMIVVKPFLGAVVFFLIRRGQWRDAAATVGSSALRFCCSHQGLRAL
jgi:hypothetical protein